MPKLPAASSARFNPPAQTCRTGCPSGGHMGAPARRTKVAPKSPVKSIASATRKMSIARRWLAMAGAVRTDFSTGPGSDGMAADMAFNGRE